MRRRRGMSAVSAGAITLVVLIIAAFFAFTRANPFASPYEVSAMFESIQNLKPRAPVRISGVDVGEVKAIEALDDGSGFSRVRMELRDDALPLREDAEAKIVPRLFLEGNFVVEIQPGSPSAGELEDGSTIAVGRTGHSVSFEQVLKVLDKDTRDSLQTLLDEYSRALVTGGARGFNRSIRHWESAYRDTSLANQGLLGTEPGDLARLVRGQQRAFEALSRDPEALKELVVDLNATAAAFASEADALEASVPALRDVLRVGSPALASLNSALPSLRAFAREALPGVRSTAPALAVQQPFVTQLRRLLGEPELRGLARDLRRTMPSLVRLNERTVGLLEQSRLLSSCTNEVLVPFANTPIPDPDFPENSGEPFYQQAQRAFVGLAGESRLGDANGQWFRVLSGSGPTTIVYPGGGATEPLYASATFPSLGSRPALPARRPDFRPDVPCETQQPPNLNAPRGEADASTATRPDPARRGEIRSNALRELPEVLDYIRRDRAGRTPPNPLSLSAPAEEKR